MDSFYNSWEEIPSGVPQGSTLGPLLFNIFMCDMFLILKPTYFTGYADDSKPSVVRANIEDVIKALEEIGENILNWFSNDEMKLNTNKCHLLLNSQEPNTLRLCDLHINNSLSEKLLGIRNLSIINILPNRVADIYIKLKSITSKLHNTSASIGFIRHNFWL